MSDPFYTDSVIEWTTVNMIMFATGKGKLGGNVRLVKINHDGMSRFLTNAHRYSRDFGRCYIFIKLFVM